MLDFSDVGDLDRWLASNQPNPKDEQSGALKEAQALILRQLMRRIGSLAPDMQAQVQTLSLTQLESLSEALLDFAEAGDLVQWLEGNRD